MPVPYSVSGGFKLNAQNFNLAASSVSPRTHEIHTLNLIGFVSKYEPAAHAAAPVA
jgi:hypothetical protein